MRKILGALGVLLMGVYVLSVISIRSADASRNSSGTMSAINGPYVPGTAISSSIINARFADIEAELTDSLSRSGKGGMTAALKEADGTAAAPSFSFTNEAGTGWWRIGAGDLGLAVLGTKKLELTSSLFTVTPNASFSGTLGVTGIATMSAAVRGADGAVGAPGYSFTSETDSGLYRIGASDIGFAVHGVKLWEWTPTGLFGTQPLFLINGAVGGPAYSFTSETNSGIYLAASHDLRMAINGVDQVKWTTGGLTIGASGTAIGASYSGTSGSVSLGSAAAATCNKYSGNSITVTGAAAGDHCIVGIDTGSNAGWAVLGYPTCQITAANTAVIQICNPSAGGITPVANTTFNVRAFH